MVTTGWDNQPPGDGGMLACAMVQLADSIDALSETLAGIGPLAAEPRHLSVVVADHVARMVADGWPEPEARRSAEEWFEGDR